MFQVRKIDCKTIINSLTKEEFSPKIIKERTASGGDN